MIQLSAKICNFVGEKDMNKPVLLSSRLLAAILVGVCICLSAQRTSAFSLALDSVAEWGKFPRFCVNVYRWGDRFSIPTTALTSRVRAQNSMSNSSLSPGLIITTFVLPRIMCA